MAKKRGRPPKAPDEVKTTRFYFRVEKAEKQQYERAAQASGLSLSEWVRKTLRAAVDAEFTKTGENQRSDRKRRKKQ